MANKRDLKKAIHGVSTELFTRCASAVLYGDKEKKENGEALLTSIVFTHNNFISMVSHPEPGMKQKDYFKNLIEEFNKDVSEFVDQIALYE